MIFKTTVLRSNPQIIREFGMKSDAKISDILKVVEIVHGLDTGSGFTLLCNGSPFVKDGLASEIFAPDHEDEWMIQGYSGSEYFDKNVKPWKICLEVVDYNEAEGSVKLPRLTRYRGLNMNLSYGSIDKWNDIIRRLHKSRRIYEYPKGYMSIEDYEVNQVQINRKLQVVFNGMDDMFKIDWSKATMLQTALESRNITDLKDIVRFNELPISYNQRKAVIIADMVRYYNQPDFWMDVLDEMSLREYEAFRLYISGKKDYAGTAFPTLDAYAIQTVSHVGSIFIAREFLRFYEQLMLEEGDDLLVELKKTMEIRQCACRLYGVFPQEALKALGTVMYPEVNMDKYMNFIWDDLQGTQLVRVNPKGRTAKNQVMYDISVMNAATAEKYWNVVAGSRIEYYLPTQEEAMKIARSGLAFGKEATEELIKIVKELKNRYAGYPEIVAVRGIYELCHRNYITKEIPAYLKRNYSLQGTPEQFRKLVQLIQKYKGEVRQIMFCGHTGDEAKARYNLEIRED